MNGLFKKLRLKDQSKILILNSPDEFQEHLDDITPIYEITRKVKRGSRYDFVLAFVIQCADIETYSKSVLDCLNEDALLWFAYPKKSSKKYTSDISRDQGWQALGNSGYEAVSQIAIDEDWSAMRFRRTRFIRSMKREKKRAMSKEGKVRAR